jgi:hypothetical protein
VSEFGSKGTVAVWSQAGPGSARFAGVREFLHLFAPTVTTRRVQACIPQGGVLFFLLFLERRKKVNPPIPPAETGPKPLPPRVTRLAPPGAHQRGTGLDLAVRAFRLSPKRTVFNEVVHPPGSSPGVRGAVLLTLKHGHVHPTHVGFVPTRRAHTRRRHGRITSAPQVFFAHDRRVGGASPA